MISKKIVSVIVLAEQGPEAIVNEAIDNVLHQTHKTLDLIVAITNRADLDKIRDRWKEVSNMRWILSDGKDGLALLESAVKEAKGDFIFYRTMGPHTWFPRHIEHHLDLFSWDKKAVWSYSLLEYHNVAENAGPYNILNFRIEKPPKPEQVILDEICHYTELKIDFRKCVTPKDGGRLEFFPGTIFELLKNERLAIPEEITVMQWIDPRPPVPVLGAPKSDQNVSEEVVELLDGQMGIKVEYPTVVGNVQHDEHNKLVLERMKDLKPEDVTKIAIKRTIGMGDVILVEPVIRALRRRYPNAEITMFTGKTRGAKDIVPFFAARPDVIVGDLEENAIVQDLLYDKKGFDLRFDFDLAYESRKDINYIDGYFLTAGFVDEIVEVDGKLQLTNPIPISERAPALVYEEPRLIPEKYVAVEFFGSGWPGKEWQTYWMAPGEEEKRTENRGWQDVLRVIDEKGLKVVATGEGADAGRGLPNSFIKSCKSGYALNSLQNFVNNGSKFQNMMNYLRYCEFFVGSDCGAMHVAAALGKKCFIVAGAAIPSMTSRSTNIYQVTNPDLTCLHCKGKQFYNPNGQGGITFVANCLIQDQYACMRKLSVDYVLSEFDKFYASIQS